MSTKYVVRVNLVANGNKHWLLINEESFSNPLEQSQRAARLKSFIEAPDLKIQVSTYEEEVEQNAD